MITPHKLIRAETKSAAYFACTENDGEVASWGPDQELVEYLTVSGARRLYRRYLDVGYRAVAS